MKTLNIKSIVILAVVLLAGYSANAQVIKEKPRFQLGINIYLEKAIKNPGLVRAMYMQVHPQDVIEAHQHIYVAEVHFNGKIYLIKGTVDEWMLFFVMDYGGTHWSTLKYRGEVRNRE